MCFNFIKESDLFAPGVTLSFKGEDAFKSAWRGLLSLLVVLGLIIAVPVRIFKLLEDPIYDQTVSKSIISIDNPGSPAYELFT